MASSLAEPNRQCTKFPQPSSEGIVLLRQNKLLFESKILNWDDNIKLFHPYQWNDGEYPFSIRPDRSYSKVIFYCDWVPKLFGIDEDEIPPSDDEGIFEVEIEELREKAQNLTEADMKMLRQFNEDLTDEELRDVWIENNIPRYARRARANPILERDVHKEFECICKIDLFYCRHYIPRFSEGVKEGEELRIPHFKAYWDEFKEKDVLDADRWSAIIEKPLEEDKEIGDMPFKSVFNKSYRKRDVKNMRKKLLANFRPLDCREVRRQVAVTQTRYRMPFAEALYLELQEDGYVEAALFFKYLLIRDYFVHEGQENRNSTLRRSQGKLLKLIAFLKLAEKYSKTQQYHKEATILLKTGKYYNDRGENWWWLAEEFYKRAVAVSEKSVIDGGKTEAISRFMLGMYLVDYAFRPEDAQEHLSKAIDLCIGKDWTAQKFIHQKQQPLYEECVSYLCRVLIIQSHELRKNGKPNEALPLIHRSYKLCRASKTKSGIEMETYFELGMTYQEVGFLHWAKVAFRKFIEIAKQENYQTRICDGYLELAICYRSEGDLEKCHQNLLVYLHTAEAMGNENLIAYGNQYLGEFHLHDGEIMEAMEYFKKSFQSFFNQVTEAAGLPFEEWKPEHFMLINDMKLNRCLLGLAQGELMSKSICQLIVSANGGPKNQSDLMRLIHWKDKGELIVEREEEEEDEDSFLLNGMWGALTEGSKKEDGGATR